MRRRRDGSSVLQVVRRQQIVISTSNRSRGFRLSKHKDRAFRPSIGCPSSRIGGEHAGRHDRILSAQGAAEQGDNRKPFLSYHLITGFWLGSFRSGTVFSINPGFRRGSDEGPSVRSAPSPSKRGGPCTRPGRTTAYCHADRHAGGKRNTTPRPADRRRSRVPARRLPRARSVVISGLCSLLVHGPSGCGAVATPTP